MLSATPHSHPLLIRASLVAAACLGLAALAGSTSAATPSASPTATSNVNYSVTAHWVALPKSITHKVDVFYLGDTAYQKPNVSAPDIGPIDAPSMIKGEPAAFQKTATAFARMANIYSPYYRQVDTLTQASMTPAQQIAMVGGTPTADAIAAFKYYLKHYNHGRPFILAGHSQGSSALSHLLSTYMKDHPKVRARMIAAYLIGYPITQSYLDKNPFLRFARGANDTGVIVSYNTEAPTIGGPNPVMLSMIPLVINPITWTRSERPASAAQNLGSLLPDAAGVLGRVNHYADARIDKTRGVIICSTCDVSQYAPGMPNGFLRGVFHPYDYPFYYFNLRHNALNRSHRFLSAHKR